jgi:hypothetical protein
MDRSHDGLVFGRDAKIPIPEIDTANQSPPRKVSRDIFLLMLWHGM